MLIETDRLRLRQLSDDDADFVLRLLNEPSFIENIGDRGVRTLDDARAYITNGPIASYEKHGFGLLLVELKEPGTAIGICGLLKRDVLPEPDIGYALLPEFWCKGYAHESATAVLDHARNVLGLNSRINPNATSRLKSSCYFAEPSASMTTRATVGIISRSFA